MIREELHIRHLDMLLQTMYFDTGPIVYIDVFLLGNSKQLVIVQPPCIPNGLSEL